MKQMLGFSAEISPNRWHKMELTLEEDDWNDLRIKYELPEKVPTTLKFLFLENELLLLLSSHVIKIPGYEEDAEKNLKHAVEQRAALIDKMKEGA